MKDQSFAQNACICEYKTNRKMGFLCYEGNGDQKLESMESLVQALAKKERTDDNYHTILFSQHINIYIYVI